MDLLTKLGLTIQKERSDRFKHYHLNEEQKDENKEVAKSVLFEKVCSSRPQYVFLQGGNGLQTQSEAGMNGGSGIILVPEIKSGKRRYTDIDGSFAPLLSFYDNHLPGSTYRKADRVLDIQNCRIQLVACGVEEDWVDFVKKSGTQSGTLARVLPIIG